MKWFSYPKTSITVEGHVSGCSLVVEHAPKNRGRGFEWLLTVYNLFFDATISQSAHLFLRTCALPHTPTDGTASPNYYPTTGNRTYIVRVAPFVRGLSQDAELPHNGVQVSFKFNPNVLLCSSGCPAVVESWPPAPPSPTPASSRGSTARTSPSRSKSRTCERFPRWDEMFYFAFFLAFLNSCLKNVFRRWIKYSFISKSRIY